MLPISIISGSGRTIPAAPTIGTATNVGSGRAYNNGRADVTFTAPTYNGRSAITSYTVTSSPGGFTGTGASSPISVTGLQSGTAYTFTVTATNAIGTSAASSASNSITATTIPQTPTITSATRSSDTAVSIAFTGATGGSALTAVTATSSPSVSITSSGTSSPMTATATYTQGQAYTFTITASNANGTSGSSSASSSVTPYPAPVLGAWSAATDFPYANNSMGGGSTTSTAQFWVGGVVPSDFYDGQGWFWNGSSWTSRNSLGVGQAAVVRIDSTRISVFGGVATYGFYNEDRVYTFNGTTQTQDTNMPYTSNRQGVASVTGGLMLTAGNGGSSNRYYKTSVFGGSWVLGTAGPFTGGAASASDLKDFTNGILYNGGNTDSWTFTSNTSAFTVATTRPGSTAAQSYSAASVINNQTLFFKSNDDTTNNYLFNGTSYTLQTATPTPNYTWYAGSVGANISIVRGNLHYRSTLS